MFSFQVRDQMETMRAVAHSIERDDRIQHAWHGDGTVASVWRNQRSKVVALVNWDNGNVSSIVLSGNDNVVRL